MFSYYSSLIYMFSFCFFLLSWTWNISYFLNKYSRFCMYEQNYVSKIWISIMVTKKTSDHARSHVIVIMLVKLTITQVTSSFSKDEIAIIAACLVSSHQVYIFKRIDSKAALVCTCSKWRINKQLKWWKEEKKK